MTNFSIPDSDTESLLEFMKAQPTSKLELGFSPKKVNKIVNFLENPEFFRAFVTRRQATCTSCRISTAISSPNSLQFWDRKRPGRMWCVAQLTSKDYFSVGANFIFWRKVNFCLKEWVTLLCRVARKRLPSFGNGVGILGMFTNYLIWRLIWKLCRWALPLKIVESSFRIQLLRVFC